MVLVLFLLVLPVLFSYLRSLDGVMVKLKSGKELQEGDWLEKDVKIGRRTISKSVHGLSLEEMRLIKRAGKKVWIKGGIPFTPAFLIAWGVMVYVYLASGASWVLAFLS